MSDGLPEEDTTFAALPARRLYRAIAPRRRWWRWAAFFAASCAVVALAVLLVMTDMLDGDPLLYGAALMVLSAPAATVFFAGALAPVALGADCRAGRLQTLLVTGLEGSALLRVYQWRALLTVVLLLAVMAPTWALFGRCPYPLMFVGDVIDCHLDDPGWMTPLRFASGFLTDVATAYLALAFGLAFMALTGNRGWAMTLAWLATIAFGAVGWLGGLALVAAFRLMHVGWYRSAFIFGNPVEPGYSALLWSFAVMYVLLAVLLSELVLRLAARGLGRLVTD